ncbi:hypothetical protein V6N11_053563 [Hibiscus sabdariffa]|uniref:Uncharacterized protein n=1 Tax=Hibiscus sabdariffa TaxID=183260 RepID=A0ABR2UDF7_9ROSI
MGCFTLVFATKGRLSQPAIKSKIKVITHTRRLEIDIVALTFATSQSHMAWITQEYVTCMLGMAIHVIWLCHGGLLVDKPHRPVKDDKINNQHQLISTYGYFTATRAGKLPSAEYISQRTPV